MSEPTPRQVLYALVVAGLLVVVAVLVVGAAVAGLVPVWWTLLTGGAWIAVVVVAAIEWRKTGLVLGLGIGLFVAWAIGTLLLR
ncbi:MAG: hypothetical protein R6X29_08475 [Acidimicrobiia bacterium]